MPLLNLTTNLKDLKYGHDQPGWGSSEQPYEVVDIPEGNGTGRDGLPTLWGPDFLLRGGLDAPLTAFTDIKRLGKYFLDLKSPSGLLFALKQNLLSRAGVKTQASIGTGTAAGLINEGLYTPIGSLLSAGLSWAGIRVNKQGLDPTGLTNAGIQVYSEAVTNQQPVGHNRLFVIQQQKVEAGVGVTRKRLKTDVDINNPDVKFTIPGGTEGNILYKYGGGPNSILGIGRTKILMEKPTYNAIRGKAGVACSGIHLGESMDNFQLHIYSTLERKPTGFAKDFRRFIFNQSTPPVETDSNAADTQTVKQSKIISRTFDYEKYNRDSMFQYSQKTDNVYTWDLPASSSTYSPLDLITAQPLYEAEVADSTKAIDDIMNFRIAAIKNGPDDGKKAVYIHFRAYMESFDDSYAATWQPVQYVGRAESFYNYAGFKRDIGLEFQIVAESKAELIPMYKKLNYLASTLAPDYGTNGLMKGTIHRLTVGSYLYEVPGIITDLTFDPEWDAGIEIGYKADGTKDESVGQLFKMFSVKLSFIPIHDFLPRRNDDIDDPTAKFISLANNADSDLYDSTYKSFEKINIPTSSVAIEEVSNENENNDDEIVMNTDDLDNNPWTLG